VCAAKFPIRARAGFRKYGIFPVYRDGGDRIYKLFINGTAFAIVARGQISEADFDRLKQRINRRAAASL